MGTLQGILRYRHQDTSVDINRRLFGIMGKGVYDGDVRTNPTTTQYVLPVPGQLAVTVSPFIAMGADGMLIAHEGAAEVLQVSAGITQYIICRSKYRSGQEPLIRLEVLTAQQYATDPDRNLVFLGQSIDALLVLAKLVIPTGATAVLNSHMDLRENHVVNSVTRPFIRGTFATVASLPANPLNGPTKLMTGDVALVRETRQFYEWNGATWETVTDGLVEQNLSEHLGVNGEAPVLNAVNGGTAISRDAQGYPAHPALAISSTPSGGMEVPTPGTYVNVQTSIDYFAAKTDALTTSITGLTNDKVAKAGDVMTGGLVITPGSGIVGLNVGVTGTANAIVATATGTGVGLVAQGAGTGILGSGIQATGGDSAVSGDFGGRGATIQGGNSTHPTVGFGGTGLVVIAGSGADLGGVGISALGAAPTETGNPGGNGANLTAGSGLGSGLGGIGANVQGGNGGVGGYGIVSRGGTGTGMGGTGVLGVGSGVTISAISHIAGLGGHFQGGSGSDGLFGVAFGATGIPSPNNRGGTFVGNASGEGVYGLGGDSDGTGVKGEGGLTNGKGGEFIGVGTGIGLMATGGLGSDGILGLANGATGVPGASNRGGTFVGKSNGVGVYGIGGDGSGTGVFGQGGLTNGKGGDFVGVGSGSGLRARGGPTVSAVTDGIGLVALGGGASTSITTGVAGAGIFARSGTSGSSPAIYAESTEDGAFSYAIIAGNVSTGTGHGIWSTGSSPTTTADGGRALLVQGGTAFGANSDGGEAVLAAGGNAPAASDGNGGDGIIVSGGQGRGAGKVGGSGITVTGGAAVSGAVAGPAIKATGGHVWTDGGQGHFIFVPGSVTNPSDRETVPKSILSGNSYDVFWNNVTTYPPSFVGGGISTNDVLVGGGFTTINVPAGTYSISYTLRCSKTAASASTNLLFSLFYEDGSPVDGSYVSCTPPDVTAAEFTLNHCFIRKVATGPVVWKIHLQSGTGGFTLHTGTWSITRIHSLS